GPPGQRRRDRRRFERRRICRRRHQRKGDPMKVGIGALLLAVSAALSAQPEPTAPPKLEIKTIPPRQDDGATIDGMVKAYYEVVSGPKGQPRDWARDRTLYIKDIRFVPVDIAKD